MMTAARRAASSGADPVTAERAIREALAPLWPRVSPEATRDVLVTATELAQQHGARNLPDGLADQTAEWLLEMAAQDDVPEAGAIGSVRAFASSVAFDRDEDVETFATVAVVLAVAFTSEPEPDELAGPEPEPAEYDPGPEVDDEGGMSEYRHAPHEPGPWS
jgi:hypothetical protein